MIQKWIYNDRWNVWDYEIRVIIDGIERDILIAEIKTKSPDCHSIIIHKILVDGAWSWADIPVKNYKSLVEAKIKGEKLIIKLSEYKAFL